MGRTGFKSSYVGSIQTVRQYVNIESGLPSTDLFYRDRIHDPEEQDWDQLGMTWIGEPIDHDFWWDIEPGSP